MDTAMVMYNNVPTPSCTQTPLSVATPDGGILYTGFKCINYIAVAAENAKNAAVKTMSTRITVNALDVSPLWAQSNKDNDTVSNKQFAIVAEDFSVQVWDCGLGEAIMGHKAHQHQHEARDLRMMNPMVNVLMGYICNGNILSMDASDLVIYCVASNTYCRRPTFISPKNHQLSVLRCSPYNEHIFALGTYSGFVMVCDMHKMSIIYKFTCQQSRICDLTWREMPMRGTEAAATDQWRNTAVAPLAKQPVDPLVKSCDDFVGLEKPTDQEFMESQQPKNKGKPGKAPLTKSRAADNDDIFDIYNTDHLECEFGAPARQTISKSCHSSDDFVGLEKPCDNTKLDFIEACKSMKADLQALSVEDSNKPKVEVTLADCLQSGVAMRGPRSDASSTNSHKAERTPISTSSEGSLEVIQFSSSSDDAVIVDGEAAKPKREVLHHIYHQAEVHDAPKPMKPTKPQPAAQHDQPAQLAPTASVETMSICSTTSSSRPDILLVSINDNEVMMIWNTLTGAHCGKTYNNKNNATGRSKQVHWLNDHTIVCSMRQQLVYWSLEYEPKQRRYKLHKNVAFKSTPQEIVTFAPSGEHKIWLSMRNRRVGVLNPQTGQLTALYGCLSFGIRAIAECPDDMNKIALGCSDKRLALFDISQLSSQCIPIEMVHVNSAIYTLAWSPDSLQLAFGTYDGLVGILDVESMKVRTTFHPVYKKEVYSLMWQENYIYFIVNHTLGAYNVHKKKDAIVFSHIERASYLHVRDIFLFVGTDDGFLQLYEREVGQDLKYTLVRQVALLSRYVTDIAFNPIERNRFAVVGHDKQLQIMEFHAEQRGWTKLHTLVASDAKASIASVKWSNLQAHLLLSFHIEGKVCLWNLQAPEQPPLTISYHCPMWCGMFLPSDENIIMCCGKAVSLEQLSIQQALAQGDKLIRSKSDALLNVKWASKSLNQSFGTTLTAGQKKRQRRDRRKAETQRQTAPLEQSEPAQQPEQPAVEQLMDALSLDTKQPTAFECSKCKEPKPDSFMGHSRSCLCLTQKELNKHALEKLAVVLTEDPAKIDKSVLMSKLFSTKVMAKDLIATELTNLKHSNNKDIAPLSLAVSTFKVRDELQQHIEHKTLNEWHISLAPTVSYVFWQKCCKAYATQMEEQGFILHAATYLSAIDMHTESINLLLKHEYFREALANARIHLPATDPMIKTIINKWLEQLEKTGNFAAAALICVLDNEMLRGLTYLRKFRNCTPEIADLMEQIKRIGQLGSLFDDGCLDRAANGSNEKELDTETRN